jgi:inorganic triphosphatase YgiF
MHETEGALVVRAERPADVLAAIAALARLDDWALNALASQTIDDTYFDDDRRSLGALRIALRVRRVDGEVLLTVKSPLRYDSGVATRIEIEAQWSPQTLQRAAAELEAAAELTVGGAAWTPSPEATLGSLGLEPVQRRTTDRARRAVTDGGGRTVAELALDVVSYDLPPGPVRLYEIEVEARADGADVGAILAALAARFDELIPWRHGKLATGFAAERAIREGALAPGESPSATLDALAHALGSV